MAETWDIPTGESLTTHLTEPWVKREWLILSYIAEPSRSRIKRQRAGSIRLNAGSRSLPASNYSAVCIVRLLNWRPTSSHSSRPHNENPKLYKWVKSADKILATVQRFCGKTLTDRNFRRSLTSPCRHGALQCQEGGKRRLCNDKQDSRKRERVRGSDSSGKFQ